jgi:hypothetical protein
MRQPIPEVTNQATYKPYNEPTQAMKNWAEQQNANATYQPYNNRIGGGFFGGGAERFSDISPGEQALLKGHTGFWDNPFGLPGKQVVEAYNINQTNMSHIFTSNNIGEWKEMKSERIGDILNDTKFQNDPKWQGIVRHVKRLREITGLKPSRGFLWLTGESVEHYIARATMLAVASGQGDSVRLR